MEASKDTKLIWHGKYLDGILSIVQLIENTSLLLYRLDSFDHYLEGEVLILSNTSYEQAIDQLLKEIYNQYIQILQRTKDELIEEGGYIH